jgi:hypothetical protein
MQEKKKEISLLSLTQFDFDCIGSVIAHRDPAASVSDDYAVLSGIADHFKPVIQLQTACAADQCSGFSDQPDNTAASSVMDIIQTKHTFSFPFRL